MDKGKLDRLKTVDTEKVASALASGIRGLCQNYSVSLFAAAYVLLVATENSKVRFSNIDEFITTSNISQERALFVRNALKNCWNVISDLMLKFDADSLRAFILYHDLYVSKSDADYTPTSISHLAIRLLNVSNGDNVADLGTGRGSFIRDCYAEAPLASYYANDINIAAKEIASLRAEILGGDITVIQENIFNMDTSAISFDKVFSNYPFGLRIRDIGYERNTAIKDLMRNCPAITKSTSSDWLFNAILVKIMKTTGKAVGIMTNGSTWNMLDKDVRKYFLESGYVETVIALPERIFESSAIATTLIVFSHNNNDVTLVDAHGMFKKGRRLNTITSDQVDQILACCTEESKYSKRVPVTEIARNDYVINPIRYMADDVAIENGVPFDSIIKSITRGAQLTASQLDSLVSKRPTDIQYLMLGNIQDGIIDENLPYLKSIDERQHKYCIKSNSLIISKNGYPFKVAVASISKGQTVLANGNLYVIELDEQKADPYYIKAFFESDKGVAALQSISVGATIPNISLEQLKKILVPSAPLEEQHALAEKYLTVVDEVKLLRKKTNKALNTLKHLFDVSEGE